MRRLIVVPIALFVYFWFFVACRGVMLFGDDCPKIVDIDQQKGDITAGFGEFDNSGGKEGVRYRGQGAKPGEDVEAWTDIEFCVPPGNTDLRVFIDTADQDSIPEHDIGGAVYYFTIPNSELRGENNIHTLPKEFPTIPGKQYVIYLAPYRDGVYCDDYRDMSWGSNDPYPGGKGVVNVNGKWMVSDISTGTIDMKVRIHGRKKCPVPPPTPTCTLTPPEPQPTPTQTEKLKVDHTIPFDDQTNVDPNTFVKIEVGFNLLMDGGGFINTSAISLRVVATGEIIPIYKVEVDGKKVYFYPVPGTIAYGTGFEATVFKDRVRAANNAGTTLDKDHMWTFGTKEKPIPPPTPMTSPTPEPTPTPILGKLKVEKTIPKDGEVGVNVNLDKLDTFFNFPIDDTGFVNQFSAELREVESDTKITLSYIGIRGKEVEFFISSGSLMSDKIYRATLFKDRIRGKNGEMMDKDFSWTFSTGEKPPPPPTPTPPKPTPTPPKPTPTPVITPTPQEKCVDVEVFNLSTRDMEIMVGEQTEIIVTVECEEGFSIKGIPIHAKMVKWDDKKKVGKISLNGLSKKYERQTVLTDDEGKARFDVEGLRDGWLKVKVNVDRKFGFLKDVVKVIVKK